LAGPPLRRFFGGVLKKADRHVIAVQADGEVGIAIQHILLGMIVRISGPLKAMAI
jgi:hypothetical protein